MKFKLDLASAEYPGAREEAFPSHVEVWPGGCTAPGGCIAPGGGVHSARGGGA